jgi:lipopolysaccharide heptosyltransferase II
MVKSILKSFYLKTRSAVFEAIGFFFLRKNTFFSPEAIRRILFIRIDRIGDLVLSTPALRAIKDQYPLSELTVLTSSSNAPVIKPNPHVDRVLVLNPRGRWMEWFRSIKRLRADAYDLAVDPYQGYALKAALIAFLSGARFKIGYDSYGRGIFYNMTAMECEEPRHLIDVVLNVLKPIGIDTADRSPEMFITDEEKKLAQDWMEANRLGLKPIIGVHPGAFYPTQRWSSKYFSELIRSIQINGEHDVIVFGGPGDTVIVDEILSGLDHNPRICTGSDLRRFAAIVSRCGILICNNSGPLHVASALGIPTISFMGPTVKEIWSPIGHMHKVLRIDTLPCIGCDSGMCRIKTHDCMRLLTPSMVMDEIMRLEIGNAENIAGRGTKS